MFQFTQFLVLFIVKQFANASLLIDRETYGIWFNIYNDFIII